MMQTKTGRVLLLATILSLGVNVVQAGNVQLPSDLVAVQGSGIDATTGLPLEVQTIKTGILLRFVPAGSFTMGSADGDKDELPVRTVNTPAFYLAKHPINNLQYEEMIEKTQGADAKELRKARRGAYTRRDLSPVTRISWGAANSYIGWVAGEEGAGAGLYTMPTEAIWEKAAQGGLDHVRYPWGDVLSDAIKKLHSSVSSLDVSAGVPNNWGLYHMTSNIFCWCADWYDQSNKTKSVRGGTWYIYNKSFRCSDRWNYFPNTGSRYIGIRIGRYLSDVIPAS